MLYSSSVYHTGVFESSVEVPVILCCFVFSVLVLLLEVFCSLGCLHSKAKKTPRFLDMKPCQPFLPLAVIKEPLGTMKVFHLVSFVIDPVKPLLHKHEVLLTKEIGGRNVCKQSWGNIYKDITASCKAKCTKVKCHIFFVKCNVSIRKLFP